jgi:CheY-like chemotaxis protein
MNRPTILIVEDNPLNVELAADLLENHGFCIRSTQTAEDALNLARELLPELVLMDISLPGMDGLCATRALRADPATSHLVIVGLTAHAMKGDEGIALDAGFDGYITKPIETRTFATTIKDLVTAHSRKQ